uniref:ARAD1D48752p n=1 Tax=Blastobotrys adeninivorans TaxID=409370 RepID=A0A060TJQ6_BLAAD
MSSKDQFDSFMNGSSQDLPTSVLEEHFSPDTLGAFNTEQFSRLSQILARNDASTDLKSTILSSAIKYLRSNSKNDQLKQGSQALKLVLRILTSENYKLDNGTLDNLASVVALYANCQDDTDVTSQVVMVLAKVIELNASHAPAALSSAMEDLLLNDSISSVSTAFALLTLLFHISPQIGQNLFSMDQLHNINPRHFQSERVTVSALEALSAACVNKECRSVVAVKFQDVVAEALKSEKTPVKLLAAAILIKTKAVSETNTKGEDTKAILDLSELLEDYVNDYDNRVDKYYTIALEGLAYTSLLTQVKKRLIARPNTLKALVSVVKSHYTKSPWVYCALCILTNLTEYPPALTPEQLRMRQLKDYAGKAGIESDREPAEDVRARCKLVFDTSIVGIISQVCQKFTTASKATSGSLMRNLVTDKTARKDFAKQGGIAALLYFLLPDSGLDAKQTAITTSALAKTFISVDPSIALSSKISPLVPVGPLVEQLSVDASDIPLLDIFEALLALTNLAAVDGSSRDAIVSKAFNKLETLLTSSNRLVQRASVELVCNLSMSMLCAEKFLDGSGPAKSRLDVVALLTDAEDEPTRIAAAGSLAVLSEWGGLAAQELVKSDRVTKGLVKLLSDSNKDLVLRAMVTLKNIAEGNQIAELVKIDGFVDSLKKLQSGNSDVASLAKQVLQLTD